MSKDAKTEADETTIDLPLVNISKRDVLGALMVHGETLESFKDSILKMQTWVVNFAEEQVAPLRESGCFTEEEIELIKKKSCVISPITLTLYVHWLQMEVFSKLPDSEKERILLNKIPDRFKARYKGNASSRNAREVSPDEEDLNGDSPDNAESRERIQHMSFVEFVKMFGEKIRSEMKAG